MVEAAGQRHPVDAVVLGADFAQATRVAGTRSSIDPCGATASSTGRGSPARPSCSISASRARSRISPTTRSSLSQGYKQNLREIETGILPQQPSLYVQHAAATEPAMAPKGHSSLYVLVPVPNLRAAIDWKTTAPCVSAPRARPAGSSGPARSRAPHPLRACRHAGRLAAGFRHRPGGDLQPCTRLSDRCSGSGRTTGSRRVSTWSAAALTLAAACRSSSRVRASAAGSCSRISASIRGSSARGRASRTPPRSSASPLDPECRRFAAMRAAKWSTAACNGRSSPAAREGCRARLVVTADDSGR